MVAKAEYCDSMAEKCERLRTKAGKLKRYDAMIEKLEWLGSGVEEKEGSQPLAEKQKYSGAMDDNRDDTSRVCVDRYLKSLDAGLNSAIVHSCNNHCDAWRRIEVDSHCELTTKSGKMIAVL